MNNLLLIDLGARLDYGVIFKHKGTGKNYVLKSISLADNENGEIIEYHVNSIYNLNDITPYLRRLETMTEAEKQELKTLCNRDLSEYARFIQKGHGLSHDGLYMFDKVRQLDWLNRKFFDWRGLIDTNQAIEVTKENNPYGIDLGGEEDEEI